MIRCLDICDRKSAYIRLGSHRVMILREANLDQKVKLAKALVGIPMKSNTPRRTKKA